MQSLGLEVSVEVRVMSWLSHLKWSRICHTRQASCAASPWTPSPPCLRSPAHSDVTSLINDNLTVHSGLHCPPSLDILQVVIQYHVKLESGDWVCVLGYLWDLCARFIGKSFTGAGSGSGLSSGERGRGRERAEAQPAAGEWGEATQAREREGEGGPGTGLASTRPGHRGELGLACVSLPLAFTRLHT